MKKFILPIMLIATAVVYGQTISLNNITGNPFGSNESSELLTYAVVKNVSSNPMQIRVRKIEVSVVEGMDNYFCWDLCFEPVVFQSGWLSAQAGQSIDNFSGHLVPNGLTGVSTIRYVFSNNVNTDTVYFDAVYSVTPVGVEKINTSQPFFSDIYPNPANDLIQFNYNIPFNQQGKLVIYNAVGGKAKEQVLNPGHKQSHVEVSGLNPGIYMAAFEVNGKMIITKRFVVKR